MERPLKVYSTKWCTDCMLVKQFLKQRKIAFEDILLETNPGAKSYIIERLGRAAKVPVIEIGTRIFSLNPFDPNRLIAELAVEPPLNQGSGE
jgi:Glutaredoxin and related proteins